MFKCRYPQWFQALCCLVLFTFIINIVGEDAARAWSIAEPQGAIMPPPGMLMPVSPAFSLPTLKGITIDLKDPFKIDFIVDSAHQSLTEPAGQEQVNLLIKYFLSFLTLPEEELWVNLSPYEKNRIITPEFETTNAGRDMLVQDYVLKQLAASLTYPDHQLGKEFWKKVLKRVQAQYGTSNIPVSSFSKVWVVPAKAIVYENIGSAYISESRLKVLTEEDYLSITKHRGAGMSLVKEAKIDHISSEITREIIIPELEREVNEGKYFASLRQMYNALILAIWFKKRCKSDLIYQVYVDQKKTAGIVLNEKQIKEKIYARYLKALKKGVYNYIKEEADPVSNEVIPRKYFSGGFSFVRAAMTVSYIPAEGRPDEISAFRRGMNLVRVLLDPINVNRKTLMSMAAGALVMTGGMQTAKAADNLGSLPPAQLTQELAQEKTALYNKFQHGDIKQGYLMKEMAHIGYWEGQLKKKGPIRADHVTFISKGLTVSPQETVTATDTPVTVMPTAAPAAVSAAPTAIPIVAPVVAPQATAGMGMYEITNTVIPVPEEGLGIAVKSGEIYIDPKLPIKKDKGYIAGEPMFYVLNQELISDINQLKSKQRGQEGHLDFLIKQGAGPQEIQSAQTELNETSQELEKLDGEKESGVIKASDDIEIIDGTLLPNGTLVNKGEALYNSLSQDRVHFNFNLPAQMNHFDRIKIMTINGIPNKGIVGKPDINLSPDGRFLEVSLAGIFAAPVQTGQKAELRITMATLEEDPYNLNSITGQSSSLVFASKGNKQYTVRAPVDGPETFFVHLGQRVREGQTVARVKRLDGNYFNVLASGSGIVMNMSPSYESGSFQSQDELMRIATGNVFIEKILFPREWNINKGDPVIVETVQGIRFPGKVTTDPNKDLNSQTGNLSDYQLIAVKASGFIRSGEPVNIILPQNDMEKQIIVDALAKADGKIESSVPPPPEDNNFNLFGQTNSFNIVSGTSLAATNSSSGTFNWNNTSSLVASNELVTGKDIINALIAKAGEGDAKGKILSISGALTQTPNGKFVYTGGIYGSLNDSIKGGVAEGAFGIGSQLIWEIAGNVTKVLSGQVNKETAVLIKKTEVLQHHAEAGKDHHVEETKVLLVDIGAADKKIAELNDLVNALQESSSSIGALPGDDTTVTPYDTQKELDQKVQDFKLEILKLQSQKEDQTKSYNYYISSSNSFSNKPVVAEAPWEIDYQSHLNLTETNLEQNPELLEVITANQGVEMQMKLQKLQYLPTFNVGSVIVNGSSSFNPFYDISEQVTGERTGNLQVGGPNTTAGAQWDILSSGRKANRIKVTLAVKASTLDIEIKRAELRKEEATTKGDIESLKQRIWEAEKNYRDAARNLELKIGSNRKLSYQLNDYRIEKYNRWKDLLDLKADYLKKIANLQRLGVLGQEVPTQNELSSVEKRFSAVVGHAVAGVEPPPSAEVLKSSQEDFLNFGNINYELGNVTSAWSSMHNDISAPKASSIEALGQILIHDVNIFNRAEALRHFIDENQKDKNPDFFKTLKKVIAQTHYEDVVWKLLKYMGKPENLDTRFFVQSIHDGHTNNAPLLAGLGSQTLGDMITMHPEVLTNLTPAALSPEVSPETANKVFLTFLAQEPKSIASENILQSDFWDTDDLAKIYHQLDRYLDKHTSEPTSGKVMALRDLIHDSIIRKVALADLDDFYVLGGFDNLGIVDAYLPRDIVTSVQISANAEDAVRSLNSPDWRGMQRFLPPKLYDSVATETQRILDEASGDEAGDPLYDLSSPRINYQESYFKSLGLMKPGQAVSDDQQAYIKQADLSEVKQIFILPQTSTPLRGLALDRLMETDQGRVFVLETYLETSDPQLRKLIEGLSWKQIAMADIPQATNAAVNKTYRDALNTMAANTGQEVYSLVGLRTYSVAELHLLPEGPIKEATINVEALPRAWQVYDKKCSIWTPWSGYRKMETSVKNEWENIERHIAVEPDPRKADAYFMDRYNKAKDPKVKSMLKELRSIRDDIAGKIRTNDQAIPMLSASEIVIILSCLSALVVSLVKKAYQPIYRRSASSARLNKKIFGRFFGATNNDNNGKNHEIPTTESRLNVAPPQNEYDITVPALKVWYGLVADWDKKSQVPADVLIPECNTVLNKFEEVLMKMPYKAELMNSREGGEGGKEAFKIETYSRTLEYVLVLALDTREIIKDRLKGPDLDDIQREELLVQKDILEKYIDYVISFQGVLYHRGSIDTVIRYKFSYKHWTEWPFAKANRTVIGENYLWGKSREYLMEDLSSLLDQGNKLIDGMYPDKSKLMAESKELLKKAGKRGGSLANPLTKDVRHQSRLGSFWGKLKFLGGFAWILFSLGSLLLGYKFFGARFSLPALAVLATVTYFMYWGPIHSMLAMDWKMEAQESLRKQELELQKELNPPGKRKIVVPESWGEKDITSISKLEGDARAKIEAVNPTVDMIVIASEDPEALGRLKEYEGQRSGSLINVPVINVPSKHLGSGNAYFYAILEARKKYEMKPHLKSWDDLNVMFVFHGKYASGQKELEYSLLDRAIKDGYRFARKDPTSNGRPVSGGHILVYTQDAYSGLMPYFPAQGIRMAGAKANGNELKGFSFVDTAGEMSSRTYAEAYHIYRNLDIADLERDKKSYKKGVWALLAERFLPANRIFKQYPVLNGRIAIARDGVKVLTDIAEFMDKNDLWETLPLSLEWDVLNPLIIQHQITDLVDFKEEINDYLDERTEWSNLRKRDGRQVDEESLRTFYEVLKATNSTTDGSTKIGIDIFEPHSKMSQLVRIANGDSSPNAVAHIREAGDPAQVSSTTPSDIGGVDLSGTRNMVQFDQHGNDPFFGSKVPVIPLKFFKGFDFQVIQSQLIPGPVELFSRGPTASHAQV